MHNLIRALVAVLPLSAAYPYGVSPRNSGDCTSISLGDFSWTVEAFTFSSSDVYTTPAHEVASPTPEPVTENVLPASWKYKSPKVAGIKLPWYASPEAQLILVAFVCFLCPGKSAS